MILETMIDFLEVLGAYSVAFGQAGEYIGVVSMRKESKER